MWFAERQSVSSSRPGTLHLTDVALRNAIFCFEYLSDYYDIAYPGDKLDHIAIPDFAAGAMENVGLIAYRDAYLVVNEDKASPGRAAEQSGRNRS